MSNMKTVALIADTVKEERLEREADISAVIDATQDELDPIEQRLQRLEAKLDGVERAIQQLQAHEDLNRQLRTD
jgi:archaellum component FlaC